MDGYVNILIMEILDFTIKEIFKTIERKAKYQKVMLFYDDECSNEEINSIYEGVKEICIFNKQYINVFNLEEINNGYKAIIYLCSAKNFLKLNFDKSEFVNLCVVKDREFLPYCVNNNNRLIKNNLFLFSSNNVIDVKLLSSLTFNKFYNELLSVVNFNKKCICDYEVCQNISVKESLDSVDAEFEFVDMGIMSKTGLKYENLALLHLVLINALILMIDNVKNKTLMLVDTYKICKEDYSKLDKFFAMASNDNLKTMLILNYNYLINLGLKIKDEILSKYINENIEVKTVEEVLKALKFYSKDADNIIGYLYLFDFFKV